MVVTLTMTSWHDSSRCHRWLVLAGSMLVSGSSDKTWCVGVGDGDWPAGADVGWAYQCCHIIIAGAIYVAYASGQYWRASQNRTVNRT